MADGPEGVRLEAGFVDLRRELLVGSDGTSTSLTTKESALLRYLAGRDGEDVSRDDLLVEVWGYRAGAATRAIDAAVQRLRAKIELDPARPRHLITVTGVGYRFIGLEVAPEPAPALIPAAAASPMLRLPDDALHGRDADRAKLGDLLAGHRLVTVAGAAGIGKTRLAAAVAASHGSDAVEVELETSRTADEVRAAVAAALGSPLASGRDDDDPDDLIGAALAARGPLLLLLDNLEQVLDAVAPLVAAWLARAPALTVLTTSREPLRVAAEAVHELAPLDTDAAVALFVARARVAHPAFDPDAAGVDTLRSLVERLDGLPLAIELAAARAGLITPARMLDRINDRFALLVSRRRDLPDRQRTLRGALDWSWELLDAAERSALAQCSVFRGVFDFDAADEVLSEGEDGRSVLDLVESLRDRSLIHVAPGDPDETTSPRLRLLASVRAYAAERLAAEPGAGDAVSERHARFFVDCAERLAAALDGRGAVEATLKLRRYADDLAVVAAREGLPPEDRAAATLALYRAFLGTLPAARSLEVIDGIPLDGLPPAMAVTIAATRARALTAAARPAAGEALARRALARVQDEGLDPRIGLLARLACGEALRARGHLVDAEAELRGTVAAADDLAHVGRATQARIALGFVLLFRRKVDEVEAICLRARDDARKARLAMLELEATRGLARCLAMSGRWEEALAALTSALAASERLGDLRKTSLILTDLSAVVAETPEAHRAAYANVGERSLAIARQLGDPRLLAGSLRNNAIDALDRGEADAAGAMFEEAASIARAGGDQMMLGRALGDRGTSLLVQGRTDEAATLLEAGHEVSEGAGDGHYVAIGSANLALVAHLRGEFDEAERLYDLVLSQPEVIGARMHAYIGAYRLLLDRARGRDIASAVAALQPSLTGSVGQEFIRILEGDEGEPGPAARASDVQLALRLVRR